MRKISLEPATYHAGQSGVYRILGGKIRYDMGELKPPTLQEYVIKYQITVQDLAAMAGLHEYLINAALKGTTIYEYQAFMILRALRTILHVRNVMNSRAVKLEDLGLSIQPDPTKALPFEREGEQSNGAK